MKKKVKNEDDIIMYCGKFKGKSLYELPSSYLRFIAEKWSEDTLINKKIVEQASWELGHRDKFNTHHYYDE